MSTLIEHRRWQADSIEKHDPPQVGDWNWPQMLRDDADHIEQQDARIVELEEKIADPSWVDFMDITDNFLAHYPPDIFTGVSGDSGPLFVVALRKAKEALKESS